MAILKHARLRRYRRAPDALAIIWGLCDGSHTVLQIVQRIAAMGGPDDRGVVIDALRTLAAGEIVSGPGLSGPAPDAARDRGGFAAACRRILTRRFERHDVDGVITSLYRGGARHVFGRSAKLSLGLVAGAGLAVYGLCGGGSSAPAAPWAWTMPVVLLVCTILHEAAHALAVKHFGREVTGIGCGWFWFGPVLYVNTSDMWLGDRRQRILVSLAGPLCDFIVAGALSLVAVFSSLSWSAALFLVATAQYIVSLINLCPVLEFDGYFALSDWLDRPNLRRHCLQWTWQELR